KLLFDRLWIAERHALCSGQKWSEAFGPIAVRHQRKSATRQPVKTAFGVEDSVPAARCSCELDRGLHALAAGAREKHTRELSAGESAEPRGELTCKLGYMTLQHGGTVAIQLVLQCLDD